MKKLALLSLVLASLISCKKTENIQPANNNDNTNSSITKCTVFTNASDSRLAQLETDDGQSVIFFGQREVDGSPMRLTGYSIASSNDPSKFDFVTLDKIGRYSNIFLRTGENLHINYSDADSIKITIAGSDSISNEFNVRKANPKNDFHRVNSSLNSERPVGIDKYINIKVTAKNKVTQIEQDVQGDETLITVRLLGQGFDYSLKAEYDYSKGLYSLPLSLTGLNYENENALDNTIKLIKNTLEVACTSTNSKDPSVDKNITKLIATSICPIPHPYAKAICLAANAVLFACTSSSITKKLNDILDKINAEKYLNKLDPNSIPKTEAAVSVSSRHYKYGTQNSAQTSISQILTNLNGYDIKIIHEYVPKVSTLTTLNVTSITSTSVSSGGNITNDGGSPITDRGVCWGTSENPTIGDTKNSFGTGTGSYESSISGLTPGKTYHVRAYATNAAGTGYGNDVSFITKDYSDWVGYQISPVDQIQHPCSMHLLYKSANNILASDNKHNVYATWSFGSIYWYGNISPDGNTIVWDEAQGGFSITQPWSISGNQLSGAATQTVVLPGTDVSFFLTKQ